MKYIIEFEDVPITRHGEELYPATAFKSLVFDSYGLDKLEPADKALKEAEERGVNKAWSLARKLEAANAEKWSQIFGEQYEYGCLEHISYEDAQSIYDLWIKNKDEIHIGDEVVFYRENRPNTVIVVTHIGSDGFIDGMDAEGTLYASKNPCKWVKTGRTFPEVAKLIEVMKTRQEEANE